MDSATNRSKGDGDAATWLPPYKGFRCAYVARQVAVKGKYGLWVTSAERDAMVRVLTSCPTMGLPRAGFRIHPGDSAPGSPTSTSARTRRCTCTPRACAVWGCLLRQLHRRSCSWCCPDSPW